MEGRLCWAESQALLEERDAAERTLLEGLQRSKDERIEAALVQLYVSWFDSVRANSDAEKPAPFALLERALQYGPTNEGVMQRLANLTDGAGENAEQAKAKLNEILARGDVVSGADLAARAGTLSPDDAINIHMRGDHNLRVKLA